MMYVIVYQHYIFRTTYRVCSIRVTGSSFTMPRTWKIRKAAVLRCRHVSGGQEGSKSLRSTSHLWMSMCPPAGLRVSFLGRLIIRCGFGRGRCSVVDIVVEERWVENAETLRQLIDMMATCMCFKRRWSRQKCGISPGRASRQPRVVSYVSDRKHAPSLTLIGEMNLSPR